MSSNMKAVSHFYIGPHSFRDAEEMGAISQQEDDHNVARRTGLPLLDVADRPDQHTIYTSRRLTIIFDNRPRDISILVGHDGQSNFHSIS